jgi:hypothetical protein
MREEAIRRDIEMKIARSISCTSITRVSASLLFAGIVGCATPTPTEQLSSALGRGDASAVANLLKSDFSPTAAAIELRQRAAAGDTSAVRILLDSGVDQNAVRETPLMAAAASGKLDVVRLLLERSADINRQQDARVIRVGAVGPIPESVKNLRGTAAEIRMTTVPGSGNCALSLAVLNRHPAIVRVLLEMGANKELVVVYKDPEFAILNFFAEGGRALALGSNKYSMSMGAGPDKAFFIKEGGLIMTNSKFEPEKKATIRELAQMSGDSEIISQF